MRAARRGVRSIRGPDAPAQPAESHLVTELLYLIERLQADYRAAAERHEQTVMELSGRIGYLQAELAGARERILALEAPKTAPRPPRTVRRFLGPL